MSEDSKVTPVSLDYEACAECYVRLMIYPGEKHPEEITEILQVHPTLMNVAGEEITNSRGLIRKVKDSSWFLSTEGSVLSKDLRSH